MGGFVQPNLPHVLFRFGIGLVPVDNTRAVLDFVAEEHIFPDGQQRDKGQFLVDDNDIFRFGFLQCFELAQFTVIVKISGISPIGIYSGKDVHQCGFSCTVLTDQCVNFSSFDNQINIIQCLDAREFFGDVFHFQDHISQVGSLLCFDEQL